ncbi:hypothetical protein ALP75_200903 [Pseudomonas syringae pv. actinidiae]|nr:hypothetical protein ALP75_200903 [Pseudomonas syringae pv. actinidiae]
MTIVLFVGFADFEQAKRAFRAVQRIADQVIRRRGQLQLNVIVQMITRLRLHEASVRGSNQGAKVNSRQPELFFTVRVEKQKRPIGFIQPLETQHAQARWHRQLRHYLGCGSTGSIGLAFHEQTRFRNTSRDGG